MKPTAKEMRENAERFARVPDTEIPKPEAYRDKATGKVFGIDERGQVADRFLPLELSDSGPLRYLMREPGALERLEAPLKAIGQAWQRGAALVLKATSAPWLFAAVRDIFGADRTAVLDSARKLAAEPFETAVLELAKRHGSAKLAEVAVLVDRARADGRVTAEELEEIYQAIAR